MYTKDNFYSSDARSLPEPTFDFTVVSEGSQIVLADETAVQIWDANWLRFTPYSQNSFTIGEVTGTPPGTITYRISNPSVASIDSETGSSSALMTGKAIIIAESEGMRVSSRIKNFTRNAAPYAHTFDGYVEDTLAANSLSELSRLANASDPENMNVFSVVNHGTSTYTRNPDYWLKNVIGGLMSATAVWNSLSADTKNPTLITPNIAIQARHWESFIPNGGTVRFVGETGTVHTATVEDQYVFDATDDPNEDFVIYKFEESLPEDVVPVKLLPDDFALYAPSTARFFESNVGSSILSDYTDLGLGGVHINQYREVGITLYNREDSQGQQTMHPDYEGKDFGVFTQGVEVGDSGLPIFIVVENALICVGQWYSVYLGKSIRFSLDKIKTAITNLGGDPEEIQYQSFAGNDFETYA